MKKRSTGSFLSLRLTPITCRHQRKRHPCGCLFARGVEFSRELRARSSAALTVPRTVIHYRLRSTLALASTKEKGTRVGAFFFGGGEGSRTPVRKPLDMTFSVGSRSFEFPQDTPKRQAYTAVALLFMIGARASPDTRASLF